MPSGKPALFLASFFLLFGGMFLFSQGGVLDRIAKVNPFQSFDAPSAEALVLDSEGYPLSPEGGALAMEEIKPGFFSRVAGVVNGLRDRLTAQVVGDIAPTSTTGFSFFSWPLIQMFPQITKGTGSTFTFAPKAYNLYGAPEVVNGITVLYTLDGTPISPRISEAPYTFTWDSAGTSEGPHVIGIVVTEGAKVNTYKPEGNVVIVDNVPGAITGPQRLAVIGPAYLEARPRTNIPEWVNYSGGYTRQHNPGNAYPYRFSPPVHTLGGDPATYRATNKWFVEPLTSVATDIHEQIPGIYRSKGGHLGVGYIMDQIGNDVKTSKETLLTHDNIDGPRNDNNVSPYTTYVANPEGPGWIGIDAAGRIFRINADGSVVTIAGRKTRRDVVPYYTRDSSVSDAERQALQIEFIGNFEGGVKLNGPTDLAFDPRNPKILYVADTYNFRIVKVDFTSGAPQITTYAGAAGSAGNVDGPARTARFKEPTSIAVASDGRVFVADLGNDNIRVIAPDGGNVTTLASNTNGGLQDPFAIRLDSQGIIILGELTTGHVKSVNPSDGAVSLIKSRVCPSSWIWLDVDRKGNLGPKDDIVHSCSSGIAHNNETRRLSRDGTFMTQRGFESTWVLDFGRADLASEPQLHYPWAIAIDDEESRIIFTGFGNSAPTVYRLAVASDPTPQHLYEQFFEGEKIFKAGTVPGFPSGDRTSFLLLRSSGGMSHIPGIKSFDEMAVMSDADLAAYIQGGMGGSILRPEITGVHLKLLMHFIRLNSLRAITETFSLPSVSWSSSLGYYLAADTTRSVISNVRVEAIDGATARVTWNTNEPTIGFVPFGVTSNYHRWSKIESGYGTTHSVVLEHLPANTTVYYAVRSKDEAGNITTTVPFTFTSGMPPGGVPPAPVPAPVPVPMPVPAPTPTPPPPAASIPEVLAGDIKAVKSGLWSDPTVWSTGVVPTGVQKVQIAGVTVEYDMPTNTSAVAEAKSIVIADGGKLNFSRNKNTRLDLDGSLMVLSGGTLEVGTQANPIPAAMSAYIGLNVASDRTFRTSTEPAPLSTEPDFKPEDVGIWVTGGGRMDINGAPKPKIWSKIAVTANAGANSVALVDTPTGWRVGDRVVVTPTGKNPDETEVRTIASISGKTIIFTSSLQHKHEASFYAVNNSTGAVRSIAMGETVAADETAASVQGEVGLLTQNVTIASNLVRAGDTNHRSHTLYMKNTSGSLSYAEFRDLGARGKLGRYPVHLHATSDTVLAFPIIGLSIWNQFEPGNKWVVLHTTQGATVRGNVGYNAQGRGFYMETADEINNIMEGNLGVRVVGPEEIPNTIPAVAALQQATRPGIFWVRAGNTVRNNVAVGGQDDVAGYWFIPSILSTVPASAFTQNEARTSHFGFYFSGGSLMSETVSNGLVIRNKVALWTDDLESPAAIVDSRLIENEGPGVRFANLARNLTVLSLGNVVGTPPPPPGSAGNIRDIKITGDFQLVKSCTASLLSVGHQCTLSVVFKPTALGVRTGTLTYFDVLANETKTIQLRGVSLATTTQPAPVPAPVPVPVPSPAPAPAPVPPSAGAGPIRIMAVGDSLTEFGFYQKALAPKLSGINVSYDFVGSVKNGTSPNDYDNEGYSGKRVGNLLSILGNSPQAVKLYQPDVVVILLGTNDMTRPDNEIASVVTQMGSLIDMVRSHEPDAFILLATIPENLEPAYGAHVLMYNPGIIQLVADKKAAGINIELVDVYTATRGLISSDKVHPTAAGYTKIGETFFNVLAPLIGSGKVKYHPLNTTAVATLTATPPAPTPPSSGSTSGLVAHLTFDTADASGSTVSDKSGAGNMGLLLNGASIATEGRLGQALQLDGSNDYVNLNAGVLNAQQTVTLAAWVYPTGPGNWPAFIAKTSEWIENGSEYVLGMNSNNRRPEFIVGGSITLGSTALPLNQWSHVVAVNSASECKIYVNGKLDTTCSPKAAPPSTSDTWKVGAYVAGSGHFLGKIDDVRVYNRALSATEAQSLYSSAPQAAREMSARFSLFSTIRSFVAAVFAPFERLAQLTQDVLHKFDGKRATALVIDVSSTSLDFGTLTVGQTSSEQVITLTLNDPTPPAPTCSFIADPNSVENRGANARLSWTTENADNVVINEGVGSVSANGDRTVSISETTSFTLTATGDGGEATCSTSVAFHVVESDYDSHAQHSSGGGGRTRTRTAGGGTVASGSGSTGSTGVTGSVVITQSTFKKGNTSNDLRTIQQLLNRDLATRVSAAGEGSPGQETGYFGSKTEDALKRFQIKYGIVSSGTPATTGFGALGPRTLAKILQVHGGYSVSNAPVVVAPTSAPTPTPPTAIGGTFSARLTPGSSGVQVSTLQLYLATDPTLYPEGLTTGYYGPATQRAVERFQARFGIVSGGTPVTTGYGAVGPTTQSKLNQIFGGIPVPPMLQVSPLPAPTPAVQRTTPTPVPAPTAAPASSGGLLFDRTLKLGDTGTDVSTLQKMLAKDPTIYPEGTVSGTFTPITELAVRRFQRLYGIASSGDAATTGYGAVGPKTQAKLLDVFGRP